MKDAKIDFIGLDFIGRGFSSICFLNDLQSPRPAAASLMLGSDLTPMTNALNFQINCTSWGFHRNSRIILSFPEYNATGFLVALDSQGLPIDYHVVDPSVEAGLFVLLEDRLRLLGDPQNPPRAPVDSLFQTTTGQFLARSGEIPYDGEGTQSIPRNLNVEATIYRSYLNGGGNVVMAIQVVATNRDSILDDPPFSGPDQYAFCGPDERISSIANWNFGTYSLSVPTLNQWGLMALVGLLGIFALGFRFQQGRGTL